MIEFVSSDRKVIERNWPTESIRLSWWRTFALRVGLPPKTRHSFYGTHLNQTFKSRTVLDKELSVFECYDVMFGFTPITQSESELPFILLEPQSTKRDQHASLINTNKRGN